MYKVLPVKYARAFLMNCGVLVSKKNWRRNLTRDFLDFSLEKAYYRGELFNSYKKELVVSFISICISSSRCSAIFSLFLDGSIQHRERVCFSWFSYYFLSFAGFFFIFSEVALLEERSPKMEKRYLFWRRANYSRVSFERYNIFLRSRPSIHGRIARLARICAPEIILHIRG
jgi:hypothetical protein